MVSAAYDRFKKLLGSADFDSALRYAEQEAAARENSRGFWITQQAVALIRMKQFARARECAQRACALSPGNPYAMLAAADACLGEGQIEQAQNIYENMPASAPPRVKERIAAGLLECLGRKQSWQQILSILPALELRPSDRYQYAARAYKELGKPDDALEQCRRWLEAAPDNPQALWMQTEIEIRAEGLDAVRTRMDRLARIPSRPPVYAEIYASLCRRSGMADTALVQYEKLHAREGDIRMARQKAFTLAKSGRETEAIEIMETLLRANPGDHFVHSSYASACERAGCLARAHDFYRELLDANPDAKGLYGRMRRIENKNGKRPA